MSYCVISSAVLYKRNCRQEREINGLKEARNFNHENDNFSYSNFSEDMT
jgi:hypothetical protein